MSYNYFYFIHLKTMLNWMFGATWTHEDGKFDFSHSNLTRVPSHFKRTVFFFRIIFSLSVNDFYSLVLHKPLTWNMNTIFCGLELVWLRFMFIDTHSIGIINERNEKKKRTRTRKKRKTSKNNNNNNYQTYCKGVWNSKNRSKNIYDHKSNLF